MLEKIDKGLAVGLLIGLMVAVGYVGGRAFKNSPWYVFPALMFGGLGLGLGKSASSKDATNDIAARLRRDDWRNGQ